MSKVIKFETLQDWRKFRNANNDGSHRSSDVGSLALANVPSMETPMLDSADVQPASSEMRGGPGFRINMQFDSVTSEQIEQLAEFETAEISDALNRMFTMDPSIRNVVNEIPLYGPAVTVKVFPGDNLMVHKALDLVKPGDVIVIDTSGAPRNASVGDMIGNKAKHLGVAGFIVDGLVRDISGLREIGLPVYATGITSFGPLHRGPGELCHAISCGGIVVNAGDAICADKSGIVVVNKNFVEDTIDHLKSQQEDLEQYTRNVQQGKFSNDWVDKQLKLDGCLYEKSECG
jgi:regulator of RNase E activity RraA